MECAYCYWFNDLAAMPITVCLHSSDANVRNCIQRGTHPSQISERRWPCNFLDLLSPHTTPNRPTRHEKQIVKRQVFLGSVSSFPSPSLDNIRDMVIVWRLRENIIRTALCWIVWHNVHSEQHTYIRSSYRSDLVCHIGTRTLCVGAVD